MRRLLIPAAAIAALAVGASSAHAAPLPTEPLVAKTKVCRQVQLTKHGKVKRDRLGYAKVAYRGTPKRLRRRSCIRRVVTLNPDAVLNAGLRAHRRSGARPVARAADYQGYPGPDTLWGCGVAAQFDANVFLVANPYHSGGWPSGDIVQQQYVGDISEVSYSCGRVRVAPLWQSFECDLDDLITGVANSSFAIHTTAHCVGGGGDMYPVDGDMSVGFGPHPFAYMHETNPEGGWVG